MGSQAANSFVVQVENLAKHYGSVKAVDGVSFRVRRGEIFGLLGPNGAGKTTAIECIEGLREPDSGSIEVLGLDPRRDGRRLRERMGVQFQTAALPDRLKVWEALDLFAALYPASVDWEEMLQTMGLDEKRDAPFAKLSGGQKQRVFIALALLNDPELVFLDELTTGLDPQARRVMWELVAGIRDRGKAVFLTTHFMEEAERLCDRVAIIDQGKIIALDTPQALIDSLGAESRVVFDEPGRLAEGPLGRLGGALRVERIGDRVIVYGPKKGLVGRVVNTLERNGIHFENLRSEQPTLEDVFLSMTGRGLRD
jgi:ABC-2 type transport system ATP-binding protein